MLIKDFFKKRNLPKIVALIALLCCDAYLLLLVMSARSTIEFFLNIISLAFVLLLTGIFTRNLFFYTSDHEKFWALIDGLTQMNQRIELLEADRANLFTIFSDELRTPLQVIHGYSSMILEGTFGRLEGSLHEIVERIFRASDTMSISAENVVLAAQKLSAAAPVVPESNVVPPSNNSWGAKIIVLRIVCVLAVTLLVLQILFAASTLTIVLRSSVAFFAVLISFFILNEFAREPEAKTTTTNLTNDFNISQNRLKALEEERAMLQSRVSVDFRASLAAINNDVRGLQSGVSGDIPEAMKEALGKIQGAIEQLMGAATSLTNILSAPSQNPKIS